MLALRSFVVILIAFTLLLVPGLGTTAHEQPIAAFLASESPTDPILETSSWFTNTDNASGDFFGVPMSMSGDIVVIGNSKDSHDAPWSGSAYVFVKNGAGWVQQQKFTPTTPATNQMFGLSVSVSGNTVVVGSPGEGSLVDPVTGAAYVYVRDGSTWILQQKLTLPEPRAGDAFGTAVAISGNTIVVTAPGDWDDFFRPGTASAFTRDQAGVWSFQQKFRASDAVQDQMFGETVALSGDTALVGSQYYPLNNGAQVGNVYVYERVGSVWTEKKKLGASNWKAGYEFGRALAIDGDIAVVGAPYEAHGSNTQGSAYVFVRDGGQWTQQQKLFIKEAATDYDFFGRAVAVHGSTIIAANSWANEQRGAAYVFTADNKLNWSQPTKLIAGDAVPGDNFGTSVAANGSEILVGTSGRAISGPSCGAVYYIGLSTP